MAILKNKSRYLYCIDLWFASYHISKINMDPEENVLRVQLNGEDLNGIILSAATRAV